MTEPSSSILVVGSYSDADSVGICIYRFLSESLKFEIIDKLNVANASYGVCANNKELLYFVNENGQVADTVTALKHEGGHFSIVNTVNSGGSAACYITVNKGLNHAFAANYTSGTLSAIAINADGSLSTKIQIIANTGSGPDHRQEGPHMHAVVLSPDERYLLAADLGIDQIAVYQYDFTAASDVLNLHAVKVFPPGTGPRHIVFSADGCFVYVIGEISATIHVFGWLNGQLADIQTIDMMPPEFEGENSAADIHISDDGRYLYASNRGTANQIVVFSVDISTGMLTYIGCQQTLGITPRNFVIDPTGRFLLVAHQNSNDVRVFSINRDNGLLTDTVGMISIDKPVFLMFV